jgi:hypothetical protein
MTSTNGYGYGTVINGPTGIAIDGSGDVWLANNTGNSVVEIVGAGAPTITPIVASINATGVAAGYGAGVAP